jgi:hypothetical protein
MAIEGISAARHIAKEQLIAERDASVPLGKRMGTGRDVANAALYLASDEASFTPGVLLPVDRWPIGAPRLNKRHGAAPRRGARLGRVAVLLIPARAR